MDELTLDGKTYISSKRAALVTGYAKDYVGQLCREGRVEARLVGRNWYVLESSITNHRFGVQPAVEESLETPNVEIPHEAEAEVLSAESDQEPNLAWPKVSYSSESAPELPPLRIEPVVEEAIVEPETSIPVEQVVDQSGDNVLADQPVEQNVVQEMQDAWHDWFKNKPIVKAIAPEPEEILLESPEIVDERAHEWELEHIATSTSESHLERIFAPTQVAEDQKEVSKVDTGEESIPIHRSYGTPRPTSTAVQQPERRYDMAPASAIPVLSQPPTRATYQNLTPIQTLTARQERAFEDFEQGRVVRERVIRAKKPASALLRTLFIVIALSAATVGVVGSGYADIISSIRDYKIPYIQSIYMYLAGERSVS